MRSSAGAATRLTPLATSRRYGPSRRKRYSDRSNRVASRAFSTVTAARSAPPPLSDGVTKAIRTVPRREHAGHLGGLALQRVRRRRVVTAADQTLPQRRVSHHARDAARNRRRIARVQQHAVLLRRYETWNPRDLRRDD